MSSSVAAPLAAFAPFRVRLGAWWGALAAAERGRAALWLPVFMGAGVVLYFALAEEPPWWWGIAVAAPAIATAAVARTLRPLLAPVAAASLGFASCQLATARAWPVAPLPTHATVLTGIVRGVEAIPAGRRITLERVSLDGDAPTARRLRVRLRATDATEIATGDTVRLRGMVRAPAPPAYPGAWDLQRDDFFNGLGGYGYALGDTQVLAHDPPRGLPRLAQWLRDTISSRIAAVLPGPEGAISATLLTGNPSAIPDADRAAFRDSGLAHLLAVAGLHIGIVMGLFLGATRGLLAFSERAALHWPCKQIAAATALAAGCAYMVLTGMHVPIVRSFCMACLFTLGVLTGRRSVSLRGLALAATVIMLTEPWQVTGVSFQMSFSAVLALIAGYQALRPHLHALRGSGARHRRFALHVAGLALTSALAGTASAPFAAYHFGHIQVYFIVANMLAVPLTAMWVMPAGLIALFLMPLGLERLALVPMGWGAELVLWIARETAAWPAATIDVPHIPPWGLAATALGMAWLGLWRGRMRLAGIAVIAAGLLSPAVTTPPDILVSADARLIGLRGQDAVMIASSGPPSQFTLDSWLQFWARGAARDLPEDADCTPSHCLLRARDGGPAALLLRGSDTGDTPCAEAAVLISPEPLRRRCAGTDVPRIDRFTVWREGAQAVWLDPAGVRIVSDRAWRGARPWVPDPFAQSRR
jgi:competence protein ComEC